MNLDMMHPRDLITLIMKRLYGYGMTTTSGGNLSILDNEGNMWISPGSVDKGTLRPEDIVCVKADGTVVGIHKPSSEFPFHRHIYKLRPDIKAVLHASQDANPTHRSSPKPPRSAATSVLQAMKSPEAKHSAILSPLNLKKGTTASCSRITVSAPPARTCLKLSSVLKPLITSQESKSRRRLSAKSGRSTRKHAPFPAHWKRSSCRNSSLRNTPSGNASSVKRWSS